MKAEQRGEELKGDKRRGEEDMKGWRGAEETAVATRRDGGGSERRGQIKLD